MELCFLWPWKIWVCYTSIHPECFCKDHFSNLLLTFFATCCRFPVLCFFPFLSEITLFCYQLLIKSSSPALILVLPFLHRYSNKHSSAFALCLTEALSISSFFRLILKIWLSCKTYVGFFFIRDWGNELLIFFVCCLGGGPYCVIFFLESSWFSVSVCL